MAPGTSRICVSCFRSMGILLNSLNYSHWSTGKCRWGAFWTVEKRMPLGRSRYLALHQCSRRNSTSDQKSKSLSYLNALGDGVCWRVILVRKMLFFCNPLLSVVHAIFNKTKPVRGPGSRCNLGLRRCHNLWALVIQNPGFTIICEVSPGETSFLGRLMS